MFTLTAKDAYIVIACDVTDGRQITGDVDPLSEEKSTKYILVYYRIANMQNTTWYLGIHGFYVCPINLLRKQYAIYFVICFHAV